MIGQFLVETFVGPRVLLADRTDPARPEEFGLAAEEVEIRRPGGGRLAGLWVEGPSGAPAVLFCPGNSGNLRSHLIYMEMLSRAGLSVLGFDYSGFGRSDGRPRLGRIVKDALAAFDRLREITGAGARAGAGTGTGTVARLGVFGCSLGANVALEVASRRDEAAAAAAEGLYIQRELVRGIINEGAMGPNKFRWIRDGGGPPVERDRRWVGAESKWRRIVQGPAPSSGPSRFLSRARKGAVDLFVKLAEHYYPFEGKNPVRTARRMEGKPVLLIHGAEDRLLPLEAALQVRKALLGPSRLWIIPGAGHTQEPALAAYDEYVAQLGDFFLRALGGGGLMKIHSEVVGIFKSEPQGTGYRVEVGLRGPAGPYLAAVVAGDELLLLRLWADRKEEGDWAYCGRVVAEARCPAEEVHAIRYHRAERDGTSWRPAAGERDTVFGRVGATLRRISTALSDGRPGEARQALEEIAAQELPPSFDLIRRLHRRTLERMEGSRGKEGSA